LDNLHRGVGRDPYLDAVARDGVGQSGEGLFDRGFLYISGRHFASRIGGETLL